MPGAHTPCPLHRVTLRGERGLRAPVAPRCTLCNAAVTSATAGWAGPSSANATAAPAFQRGARSDGNRTRYPWGRAPACGREHLTFVSTQPNPTGTDRIPMFSLVVV